MCTYLMNAHPVATTAIMGQAFAMAAHERAQQSTLIKLEKELHDGLKELEQLYFRVEDCVGVIKVESREEYHERWLQMEQKVQELQEQADKLHDDLVQWSR